MLRSCIAAFSMYSKIPMPKIPWDEKALRYSMCFFPIVGLVLAALEVLAYWLCADVLHMGTILNSAVLTVLPVLVTGGIHVDGYLDTVDAISSWKTPEERRQILKDPHIGAFAVIFAGVLFLLYFGGWSEIGRETMGVAVLGFVLSRCLSGLSVVTFPKAGEKGTVKEISKQSPKSVKIVLILEGILALVAMILLQPVCGIAAGLVSLLIYGYYYVMSKKRFGGITGDLAGYFLCLCELGILLTTVLVGRMGAL